MPNTDPQPQPEPGVLDAIYDFPRYAVDHLLALLKAALTRFEVTALVVFGVLLSLATTPLVGATVALGLYTTSYFVVTNLRATLAQRQAHNDRLTAEINFLSRVIRDNPYFTEKVSQNMQKAGDSDA